MSHPRDAEYDRFREQLGSLTEEARRLDFCKTFSGLTNVVVPAMEYDIAEQRRLHANLVRLGWRNEDGSPTT